MAGPRVDAAEVARILGVARQRVAQLAAESADFPAYEVAAGGARRWSRPAIQAWAASHSDRDEPAYVLEPVPWDGLSGEAGQLLKLAGEQARDLYHPGGWP